MINYVIYTQLLEKLAAVSSLTASLGGTAGSFYGAATAYLTDLSAFAEKFNLYISSDVSVALDKLLTYMPPKETTGMRREQRKYYDAFAADTLEKLNTTVKDFLDKDRRTFTECEDVWRQVTARIAFCKDLSHVGQTELAQTLIAAVKADAELLPYYVHISGFVGTFNAKLLLENVLPQIITFKDHID